MIRVLMILAALLLGLIGLFMSVCGGGFAFATLFKASVLGPGAAGIAVIAIPSAIFGVMLIGASIRLVHRAVDRKQTDANR